MSSRHNWFCDLFLIECDSDDPSNVIFKENITYKSKNISSTLKPLSVIEWHFNFTEYSYTNHDDHPHLHKQNELLHVSFIDRIFYENPKKNMFIPLRQGLREIGEIILIPLDEKNNEIRNGKCYCISSTERGIMEFFIGNDPVKKLIFNANS
jgi:hypothetical protein